MAWAVLLASAVLEAVWATALGASQGFTRPAETAVFLIATIASMAGLAWSIRRIPLGTAYAVWVGVGASLTVAWSVATGAEEFSWPKALFVAGIVACSAGLKALGGRAEGGPRQD
ncbi:multidrug efflux SMR transporter [Sinomonas flava]|uniref:Multidrug efflux SMR transporter n=1 Tax=Sinomonas flava TaxID=496857 RepID=A0ABP5NID1_9MICC